MPRMGGRVARGMARGRGRGVGGRMGGRGTRYRTGYGYPEVRPRREASRKRYKRTLSLAPELLEHSSAKRAVARARESRALEIIHKAQLYRSIRIP